MKMMGMSLVCGCAFNALHTSKPDMLGIMMSSSTMSGGWLIADLSASMPSGIGRTL